jgi:hypothetical protein
VTSATAKWVAAVKVPNDTIAFPILSLDIDAKIFPPSHFKAEVQENTRKKKFKIRKKCIPVVIFALCKKIKNKIDKVGFS